MKSLKTVLSIALSLAISPMAFATVATVPSTQNQNAAVKVFAHKSSEDIKGITTFSDKVDPAAIPAPKEISDNAKIKDALEDIAKLPQVTYEIKALSGKTVKSSATVTTLLKDPVTISTYSSQSLPECILDNGLYHASVKLENPKEGFDIILIPADLTDDGVSTAVYVTLHSGNLEVDPDTAGRTCPLYSGDATTTTMARVANLPLDQSTSFVMKDGTEIQVTPHVTKPTQPAAPIKA